MIRRGEATAPSARYMSRSRWRVVVLLRLQSIYEILLVPVQEQTVHMTSEGVTSHAPQTVGIP